jgi:hypothetical protein
MALSLVGIVASLIIAFSAGCAGDTKGGALGNPLRALQLENLSVVLLVLSLAVGSFGFVLRVSPSLEQRVAYAAAFFIFGSIALWFIAMVFEGKGVSSCF